MIHKFNNLNMVDEKFLDVVSGGGGGGASSSWGGGGGASSSWGPRAGTCTPVKGGGAHVILRGSKTAPSSPAAPSGTEGLPGGSITNGPTFNNNTNNGGFNNNGNTVNQIGNNNGNIAGDQTITIGGK